MAAHLWHVVLITFAHIIHVHTLGCGTQVGTNHTEYTHDIIDYMGIRFEVFLYPAEVSELIEGETTEVALKYSVTLPDPNAQYHSLELRLHVVDTNIATITSSNQFLLTIPPQEQNLTISIRGNFLGRTYFYISYRKDDVSGINSSDKYGLSKPSRSGGNNSVIDSGVHQHSDASDWILANTKYDIVVIRGKKLLNDIFIVVVVIMVLIANIGMGCIIELKEVKEVLRRPIAPSIGFLCQFIIMPLAAFGLVMALGLEGGLALGLFAAGCSPGGGASNIYTYLFNGDVSLSVTMTLLSTTASFGMIPLWIFTLGQYISNTSECIKIPYPNIFATLMGIIIPVGIGLLIKHFRPSAAGKVKKALRPVFAFFILFMCTFGVWVNLYMFKLFTPRNMFAGAVLPYTGFTLGGLIAFISKQDTRRIRSIAIETGIQNTGIAILIMKFSLPAPDGDLAMVAPVVVAVFTPAPLLILLFIFEVYKRCFKKKKSPDEDEEDEENHSVTFSRLPNDETDASQLMDYHDDHSNGNIQGSSLT